MKKSLLVVCLVAGLVANSALATVTFTASPSSQPGTPGGTFNVTFGLTVTGGAGDPANITAFDLYVATAAANSGLFSITSATGIAPYNTGGPGVFSPDPLSTAAASGFVRNGLDMGFSASSTQSVPQTNQGLETLQFSISNSVTPGTYTFSTTTTANSGGFFSDVSDSNGNVFEGSPGTFQITVVPEPSTWSLLGLGSLGCVGVLLRRRRVA